MQLLRQALDKLQSETRILDDELACAREQAIFSEFERAELNHELETVSAQLQASQASKAELEDTISKVGVETTAADHSMHVCVQMHVCLRMRCMCKCMFLCKCMCAAGWPCKALVQDSTWALIVATNS